MARKAALPDPTNVPAQTDIASEVKRRDINLSEGVEIAQENAVRESHPKRWIEENRKAFAEYDGFVEGNGVFSDGKRLF